MINLIFSLSFDVIFTSDNLVTWNRNLSFLGDLGHLEAIIISANDSTLLKGLI
jgi:hypothetical protein